jgi:hypothetical protein
MNSNIKRLMSLFAFVLAGLWANPKTSHTVTGVLIVIGGISVLGTALASWPGATGKIFSTIGADADAFLAIMQELLPNMFPKTKTPETTPPKDKKDS